MYTYIIHISTNEICIHDLPKFEHNISWTFVNACFYHQATQTFVSKRCATFSFIFLTMKLFGNYKIDTPFFISNEMNKNIMLNFIQIFIK